ncbi:polysaccharide biosynthesis protein [Staphylococcus agnetis]|uniref:polysaccharide biosynthesis protein n=1 Tax=Staphylococcus agnetis TaxID=985762 RepID=UPI000CCFDD87|nr:polysaccharide biosynthesis protein [Staphylococcus agnetis]MBY7665528.1 polysaccharide biosynthesis protein [Staphylococcus agnetis]NJH67356.1 oligosaccharide flippase family protein [Staphylococcus agnetis]NJH78856.1 oligosaccharide flippase family protein [Staphylococcus agnetis]PNY87349.1 polysaccharide biosynthesis protein [Staphylococcus agnetis]PTH66422.1 polysaccharide biosynthesis protein [Staphylococcus agnetis]
MSSKSAFNGVVVLTLALIVVKILSALYRVPYQNILGDDGLYAYQQIYPIVALGVVLASNAIPSALTQILGGREANRSLIRRLIFVLELIGCLICLILFLGADLIASLMGDSHLAPMIRAASVTFIIVGALGVLRGYFQSTFDMNKPAFSQVIEQMIRVSMIGIVILFFTHQQLSIYDAGMWAILASSCGFIGATLFLWWWMSLSNATLPQTIPWRQFAIATVIFALSQLIVILWQVVDSFTVINVLQHGQGLTFKDAITQKGIYDRGASFIQMGLIVTTTFCFVLIPLLTDTQKAGRYDQMNSYANASLKITIVISCASAIGLMNLLPLLNAVFFKSNDLTITLSIYMLTVIFVSLIMMYIALLEVQNHYRVVFIGIIIGLVIKLLLNLILILKVGIVGASISTVVALVVFAIYLHRHMIQLYALYALRKFYLKLVVALLTMTASVQLTHYIIPSMSRIGGLLELIISACIGVGSLSVMLVWMRILNEDEWVHLPFGDKIIEIMKRRKS